MNSLSFWNQGLAAALVNHLWQSTVAVGIAWLLTLALKNNYARVRYSVWFGASLKFLLPFSLLIAAGRWARSLIAVSPISKPVVAEAFVQMAQPFSPTEITSRGAGPMAAHPPAWVPYALLAVWICGALLVAARFANAWWRANKARRAALPIALPAGVPVLCTPVPMEPGVFGIFRPVLLLPDGILERLSAAQLRAIVAHEMCHVRRRDNLTFALHQLVTALFWFHPAVWWIGTELLEERERACDEAVVRTAETAETYAEGILNVCRFYLESPAACVAGVTGADLKQRIVRIMSGTMGRKLSLTRKLMLAALVAMVVGVPVMAGLAWATQQPAQQPGEGSAQAPPFDVVSVKTHKDEGMNMRMAFLATPDGVSISGVALDSLFRAAFDVSNDRILNAPAWTKSTRFDIEAKVAAEDAPKLKAISRQQRWAMLLPVFEDRFALKFHHETREMEVYTLVVDKGGPKLKEVDSAQVDPIVTPPEPGKPGDPPKVKPGQVMMQMSDTGVSINAHSSTTEGLAGMISQQIGSTVVDKTGLTGKYDYSLSFTPDENGGMMMGLPHGPPSADGSDQAKDPVGPSIFTAVKEQLGLKLVPEKEKVDVIVIDHIELPSAN